MRLTTLRIDGSTRAAIVDGDSTVLLDHADVGDLLRSGVDLGALASTGERGPDFAGADLAPLIVTPGKIVCVGQNYRGHIAELGNTVPDHPTLFAKYTTALVGARDDIRLPTVSEQADWEAELTIVIGTAVSNADAATARAAIAGYTVSNDVSVRDWQRRTSQFLQGKTFDATTPLGPVLVTVDEIGTEPDLRIETRVDGVVKQSSSTSDMLFGVVEIVEYVSQCMSLAPGDVILTGTPAGVGAGRDPQEFLAPGMVVECSIERIGSTRNTCVRAGSAA
ncbi:fumarylacetoacetate hydrolase family protein [Marisediminicola sp. LYQ85]|uniref:fumarylacetoacetate hydrolase family protein n=1 Tax=Marisediminicola sp. LYQ85 TaxID=3391062 RepID=UPI00398322C2